MANNTFLTLADKYEPPIRKALIEAWNSLRTQESRAAIARALESGGVEGVMVLFENMDGVINAAISQAVDEVLVAGTYATITVIPASAILNPDFVPDMYNPYTIAQIRDYKLGLIKSLSNTTKEAMRQSLTSDLMEGRNPLVTARDFKNMIGLTPFQEKAVRNYRKYLETLDPQALQRALRDKRYDRTIINAIASGKGIPADKIDKMVNRYRERYIKYRSQVIARTESLRAISIGNEMSVQQLIANGDLDYMGVKKFWDYTHDHRVRHPHTQIPGLNPKGRYLNESFVTPGGPLRFPRDPRGSGDNTILCRCTIRYKATQQQEVYEL